MERCGAASGVAGWQGALLQTSSRGLRDYYFCSRFERYKLLAANKNATRTLRLVDTEQKTPLYYQVVEY